MTALKRFFSLENDTLFALTLLLAVVPLWLTVYLPLVDIPQHAAQVGSLHELWRNNPTFTSNFEINWFTPYLLGYLLLFAVSTVLPVILATKVVVSAAVIAFPVAVGALLREIGADQRLRWLAIPGGYSFAFYWGFMVYMVAIPVALAFFVLTIRFERNPTPRRGIGIAAFSIVLFYCHLIALGFGSLLALSYLFARNLTTPRRFAACAVPYMAPLPLIALWMSQVLATEASVQRAPLVFASVREHLVTLFTQFAGLDGYAFAVSLALVIALLVTPPLLQYRFSTRPERWLPLVIGVATYFAFPTYWQNTAFLYQRLAVFLIPLWLLVWDVPKKPNGRPLAAVVIVTMSLWLGVNTARFSGFAQESQAFANVLDSMEPGKRVAGMLLCNSSPYFSNPVYLHFAAWYQAGSGGIADMSFATTHPSMVRYQDMERPRYDEQLAWRPAEFVWVRDGGADYDYFLVCAGDDVSGPLFKEHLASVHLASQDGSWWLYENLDRQALPQASTQR